MFEVYITKTGKYLPNEAISNDEMEDYLGLINEVASKARRIILRNNKIVSRYYALDKDGNSTHNNAELTRNAIAELFDNSFSAQDMELLSCGTSTPDNFLPSHAAMVHGLLRNKSVLFHHFPIYRRQHTYMLQVHTHTNRRPSILFSVISGLSVCFLTEKHRRHQTTSNAGNPF